MEMIHRPGDTLTCLEVRETLSDLIDARRGEIPYPGGTRLAEPGMRSAVELHLAGCADCSDELLSMEEVGLAFSEYAVGEPPAQVFAEYPRIIRERLARENALRVPTRNVFAKNRRSVWLTLGVSGIAAALAFAASLKYFSTQKNTNKITHLNFRGLEKTELVNTPPVKVQIKHLIPGGGDAQFVSNDYVLSAEEPSRMKQIQDDVDQYKYVILAERPEDGEQPLFGAYFKTARDADATEDDKGVGGIVVYDVVPGSPAAQMDLRKNDRIVTINGMAIDKSGPQDVVNFLTGIRHLGKDAPVTLHVLRAAGSQWFYMKPPTMTLGDYK